MLTEVAEEILSDAAWRARGLYLPAGDWRLPFRAGHFQRSAEVPERGIRLILAGEGEEPAWVAPTLSALGEALALPANWDSYGAYRVDPKSVDRGLEALCSVMASDTLPPAVVPTVQGGIQFEWHTRGIDLEIEVGPTGHPYVSYQNRRDETEWEGEFNLDLGRLRDLISRLSDHP